MEILVIILIIICGSQFYFSRKQKQNFIHKQQKIEVYNEEVRVANIELEEQNSLLKQEQYTLSNQKNMAALELNNLNKTIEDKTKILSSVDATIKSMQANSADIAKQKADMEYATYKTSLEKQYQEVLLDLTQQSNDLTKKVNEQKELLQALESKQNAYIEDQKRKELIAAQADYFKLILSDNDIQDIQALRQIQNVISHKEAIDKVIWDVYYKSAYDTLASHIFNVKDKVCGIYKITCLTTEKAYIGQSVDVKERLKQHIKSALSHSTTSNKLYQEMKKYNPYDFTFELLEQVPREQLNERETYWISFYKTNDYGLNSTRGGA